MKPKGWVVALIIVGCLLLMIGAVVLWEPGSLHRRESGPRVGETPTESPEPTSSTEPTAATSTAEPTVVPPVKPKLNVWTSSAPVVFARSGALWAVREDGQGKPRRINTVGVALTYQQSPDRRLVAYTTSQGGKKALHVVDPATNAGHQIAKDSDAFQGFAYAWSPTSDAVVYTVPVKSGAVRIGENLYIVEVDARFGSGDRRLLAGNAGSPAWGPNDTIVFRRVEVAHGTWRLFTIGAGGGAETLVPSSNQATSYGWARARSDLAFTVTQPVSRGGVSTVWVSKQGETSPQPVLQEKLNKATFVKLVWSPDGRLIAVDASGDDGYSRVKVINAMSPGRAWQVQEARDDYLVGWSVDGTRLLYCEGNVFQGAPSNLWSVRRGGTSRRVVVTDAAGQ